jgi:GntR family transcriptional regulator
MQRETQDRVPAYRRIHDLIQNQIESGELKPGNAVASERDLARTHGVSLMTARHALEQLEQDGLVERRQGAGTFVAPPKIHFNRLASFTEQMAIRNLSARSRVLCARLVAGEHEMLARLSLPTGGKLVKIERLRLAGGEPFALEACYLPAERFPGLLQTPLGKRSLYMTLEQDYGVQLGYADDEVDATAPDARTSALLKVPGGAPVLRIRQVLYSSAGEAIVYSRALYRSDRYSVLLRRFRKGQ